VYDTRGQQIISPLLNVAELRDLGVTFHTNITTPREALPGEQISDLALRSNPRSIFETLL
jgi:hypothetical protein